MTNNEERHLNDNALFKTKVFPIQNNSNTLYIYVYCKLTNLKSSFHSTDFNQANMYILQILNYHAFSTSAKISSNAQQGLYMDIYSIYV